MTFQLLSVKMNWMCWSLTKIRFNPTILGSRIAISSNRCRRLNQHLAVINSTGKYLLQSMPKHGILCLTILHIQEIKEWVTKVELTVAQV